MRAEYYPVVTRKNSGVALYDVTTNTVRIGGVGSVPRDVGVSERLHFAPRLGAAYRIGDKWVVRGGFGVSTDPFSLARLFRTNYPAIVAMDIVAAELVRVRRAEPRMASRPFRFRRSATGSSIFQVTSRPAPWRRNSTADTRRATT